MNRADLTERLAERLGLRHREARELVDLFFEELVRAFERDRRIELRGFGSFRMHAYRGYRGHNPRTGEPVEVLPKRLPLFKPSRKLLAALPPESEEP